ncbi:hypothetical protein BDR04DRAFT_1098024 [Suillus decipiens]|nr:hypothetical protein BDR04DRAFT_1098024 [Suillus decipiens]
MSKQYDRDIFERGVALLSQETIVQTIVAKRAVCESMHLHVIGTPQASWIDGLILRRKLKSLPIAL